MTLGEAQSQCAPLSRAHALITLWCIRDGCSLDDSLSEAQRLILAPMIAAHDPRFSWELDSSQRGLIRKKTQTPL